MSTLVRFFLLDEELCEELHPECTREHVPVTPSGNLLYMRTYDA